MDIIKTNNTLIEIAYFDTYTKVKVYDITDPSYHVLLAYYETSPILSE